MTNWIQTVAEHTQLYSPIGLRLVDDLTGTTPRGRIDVYLATRGMPAGTGLEQTSRR